jgi:hypothetical protein
MLTLPEARRIIAECETSDPERAIEAVAVLLRFEGIADKKLIPIAEQLEGVARSLRAGPFEVWFGEWELVLPQDARDSFRALLAEQRGGGDGR